MKKLGVLALATYLLSRKTVVIFADIINPVTKSLGGNDATSLQQAKTGQLLLTQFVSLWRNAINVGAIVVLIFYIWGGVEWITAGGESSKLEKARTRILQATIGLLVLVASFVIVGFLSYGLFGSNFDILNLQFLTPN